MSSQTYLVPQKDLDAIEQLTTQIREICRADLAGNEDLVVDDWCGEVLGFVADARKRPVPDSAE